MIREFAGKYFVALIQWTGQLLNDSEFKSIRLLNGVYLQRNSYMVRFAIPCGVLNATQLYACLLYTSIVIVFDWIKKKNKKKTVIIYVQIKVQVSKYWVSERVYFFVQL